MTRRRRQRSNRSGPERRDRPLSTERARCIIASLVLFLISLAVFWPSRTSEFVWDDQPYNLAGNETLMRGDYAAFWTHPYRDFYIPVSYTAWTAIAELTRTDRSDTGLRPEPFHTANLLLHAANAVLVFFLIYSLVPSVAPAALGAAFFAVHPLQVESVVWVSELRGLLASFFLLIALLLYRRYRQTGSHRVMPAAAATVSFALSILAKPSTTSLPLIVLSLDVLFHREVLPRRWWVVPALWALLAIPVMMLAKALQPTQVVEFVPSAIGRVAVGVDALAFYVGKVLLPWPLSPSYGRTPDGVSHWRMSDFLWVLPLAIGFTLWWYRRAIPAVSLGAAIALSALLPVLGLVPFKGQNFSTVADRYMYVPLVGVALAIGAFAGRVKMTPARWLTASIVLVALTTVNVQYQGVWQNELTLWRHAANTYPNQPRVHNNYGAALQVAGFQEEAIAQFDLALQSRPRFSDAYCNRGSSFGRLHRYSEALADENRAIELDSSDGACWYNRAATLFYLGRYDEALHDLGEAEHRGYRAPAGFADAIRHRAVTMPRDRFGQLQNSGVPIIRSAARRSDRLGSRVGPGRSSPRQPRQA